jgi:hypothetical protein
MIEDFYQDEWSLVETVLDDGKAYQAMIPPREPSSFAKCDCSDGEPPSFL